MTFVTWQRRHSVTVLEWHQTDAALFMLAKLGPIEDARELGQVLVRLLTLHWILATVTIVTGHLVVDSLGGAALLLEMRTVRQVANQVGASSNEKNNDPDACEDNEVVLYDA